MHIPSSTYRIQFNSSFTFRSAREVVPYLSDLGISTLYASPIFKARAGSTHGYDVVDPNLINPQVGTREEFEELVESVRGRGMGWLQDFVPNHMAYASDNHMLMDIFEKGPGSPYSNFFDVVWDHLRENLRGKLIAPFLGGPYGETLERGEISLVYGADGFRVKYWETVYPLRIESYAQVIGRRIDSFRERLGEEDPDYVRLFGILQVFKNLPEDVSVDGGRNAQITLGKELLWQATEENEEVRALIDESVSEFNRDVDLLDGLLRRQWFRLSFWRVATKEINYQRFFNINELISLRMEDEGVFHSVHGLVLGLLKEGRIDGLRIDHVDGLYDPTSYLRLLREQAPDAYVVVEKILEMSEQLPSRWPVQGTTGYDFLTCVNGLFCDPAGEDKFQDIYAGFTGKGLDFEALVYEKKKLLIERHLTGDLDNLTYVLKKISITTRHGIDLTWIGLKRALSEMSALFPVYRTYFDRSTVSRQDRYYVEEAIKRAKVHNPELARELDFIEMVLWVNYPEPISEEDKELWLSFVMRFQQFTSPLMAKGLEDTALYIFNRLISLNEVGGNPSRFGVGVGGFHEWNRARSGRHPNTLNATATHDTKRGEDTRARINVLSEIPDEWARHLERWSEQNRKHKAMVEGEEAPIRNREYFLYQTLLGSFPFDEGELADYAERVKDYMIKAAREAKVRTFWQDPNLEYESALTSFVGAILSPEPGNEFLESFRKFQRKVAHFGAFNSLSQVVLKITSPGVPDFYQGTELWDFSLVDPDNRRAVDYQKRRALLREIREREQTDLPALLGEMLSKKEDGRVKLFTVYRALKARNESKELFDSGEYIPLSVTGARSGNVVAFARRAASTARWAVTLAPRLLTSFVSEQGLPLGQAWEDTQVALPEGAPATWRDAFTGEALDGGGGVRLSEAFGRFPVSLLTGE
ncbi:MAG TPA: malto-oligosyltrehalose synthase [Blastocatellia bacterium]|nr:malto-oligosyltrehalose synthase [Blastocatellia bacterium]